MTTWKQIDERHWETKDHRALVSLAKPGNGEAHLLLVWRKDSKPLQAEHWHVLQSAKSAIFGPETWAAEVYPAESEKRDRAHIYWLHVFVQPGRPAWVSQQRRSVHAWT